MIREFIYSDRGERFKDFIFGFQDGLISTYVLMIALIMLVYDYPFLLLIALIAEMISGSISMGFGAYISIKTKNQCLRSYSKNFKTKNFLSSGDLLKSLKEKGSFYNEELDDLNKLLKKHPKIIKKIRNINSKELNIREPTINALFMTLSFIIGSLLPLAPFIIPMQFWSFIIATIFSFGGLFIVGVMRSLYSERHWLTFGFEMVLIGLLATLIISVLIEFITLGFEYIIVQERFG